MAPFKSSKGRNLGKLVKSYLTANIGGNITTKTTLISGPITATGGTKYTPGNGFIYHMISVPQGTVTFAVTEGGGNSDILIVGAGGGGGGGYYAGGGGAGQVVEGVNFNLQPGTYTVAAGTGGVGGVNSGTAGNNGGNSNFGSITALGGGTGGSGPGLNNSGGNGGSGGGASYYVTPGIGTALAITPTPYAEYFTAYGNDSSASRLPGIVGGGGGGAGSEGGGTPSTGTAGGQGRPMSMWPAGQIPGLSPVSPFMGPLSDTFGGGGGGGAVGPGGVGGGANGGSSNGFSAPDFLGGGGGGSSASSSNTGGDGGPGVVLIRYAG